MALVNWAHAGRPWPSIVTRRAASTNFRGAVMQSPSPVEEDSEPSRDAKKYILETTGNGVALFDFDEDGLPDIFIANGTTLDGDGPGQLSTGHLYRNRGGLRFDDVTERAGLARVGWGQGVCVGDYDN